MLHDILLGDNKNLDFFQTACFSLERHRLLAHLSGIKDRVITCTGLAEAQKIKTTMQLERHNMSLTAQALIKVLAEDCKREVFAWNVAGLPPEAVNAVNLIGEKSI